MTRRAAFRQADVARAIRGAIAGGLQPGTFRIDIEGDRISILPIAANGPSDDAADLELQMREAFGEDPASTALKRARARAERMTTKRTR
jgi:hypothetical protein